MTSDPVSADTLRKNALGAPHIVFFVIAAAAPLTAVVGVTPAAFMLGNGPGVPVTFLLVGGLYLVFAAGFTAMSGFVMSAGGFYAYIKVGLGPAFGLAGALFALATYTSVAVALYGLFGFFLNDLVRLNGGPDIAWWIYAVALATPLRRSAPMLCLPLGWVWRWSSSCRPSSASRPPRSSARRHVSPGAPFRGPPTSR